MADPRERAALERRMLSNGALRAAADAYAEGLQPGDEYFGDPEEIAYMAEKVVRAALQAAMKGETDA